MCKYLIGAVNWLAPLRPRLPLDGRVELFQLRAICASLSRPTSKGLISSVKRNVSDTSCVPMVLCNKNQSELYVELK